MHGQISKDTEVGVAASTVWDVYRGLEVGKLAVELVPEVFGKLDVVEGDGGVGTILKFTFPAGTPGVGYTKEKFMKIDDDSRIKETEIIEGGYKDLGFDLYRVHAEIIEKDTESTIIRSTIEYEIDDKLADKASLVTTEPLETLAEHIGKYLSEKKATA